MHFVQDVLSWGANHWPFQAHSNNSEEEQVESLLTDIEEVAPAEPTPAEPENNDKTYLLKIGNLKVRPYWTDDEEEDNASLREPIGAKQHAAFVTGFVLINTFSAYFYKTPIVAAAFAGGAIEFTKTWYSYNDNNFWIKNGARTLAVSALAASIFMRYGLSDATKMTTAFQVLNAIPFAYPAMGILKAELSKAEIHTLIQKGAEKCKVHLSDTQAQVIAAILQIAPALSISMAKIDDSLTAATGVFAKTNIRELTNIAGKYIMDMQDSCRRKAAGVNLTIASIAATTVGYAGTYLQWFNNLPGTIAKSLLIVPGSDIGARVLKESVKGAVREEKKARKAAKQAAKEAGITLQEPEETRKERAVRYLKKGLEAIAFTLPVLGASLGVGQMINPTDKNTANAGLVASVLGDAISVIKVATKRFKTVPVMTTAATGILAGAVAYTMKELAASSTPWPLYSSTLLLASITAAFELYHLRDLCRPPKVKAPTSLEVIEEAGV